MRYSSPSLDTMDDLSSFLDYLTLPVKVVDLLREQLLALNIPAPAPLMQLLAAVVFGWVAWYFIKQFKKTGGIKKFGAGIVAVAAAFGIVGILAAWADEAFVPRSEQLVGTLTGHARDNVTVELHDARSQAIAVTNQIDERGTFVLSYEPVFSDPPRSIQIITSNCKPQTYQLGRNHLHGTLIQVSVNCEAL